MITVPASGTQAATIGTTHTLYTTAAAGIYVLAVDVAAMGPGDFCDLIVSATVLGGGTIRDYVTGEINGAQVVEQIWESVPIVSDVGADFKLLQHAGTGRSFPWKVMLLS